MGCGSSKNAGEETELARPAQAGVGGQKEPAHAGTNGTNASVANQNPAQSGTTEKEPTNPDNPIVFFDVSIGGQYSLYLCSPNQLVPRCANHSSIARLNRMNETETVYLDHLL